MQGKLLSQYLNSSLNVEEALVPVRVTLCLCSHAVAFCRVIWPGISTSSAHAKRAHWLIALSPVQAWPFSVRLDRVPAKLMRAVSLSSLETLQLNLSPACFESVRDIIDLVNDFQGTLGGSAAPDLPAQHSDTLQKVAKPLSCNIPAPSAVNGSAPGGSPFEIVNRTGLGLACYPDADGGLQHDGDDKLMKMRLPSAIASEGLTFAPATEYVHVPDFGRRVRKFAQFSVCCGIAVDALRCRPYLQATDANWHYLDAT